jgi:hypothetical protein
MRPADEPVSSVVEFSAFILRLADVKAFCFPRRTGLATENASSRDEETKTRAMKKQYLRALAGACLAFLFTLNTGAATPPVGTNGTIVIATLEDFSRNPLLHGWQHYGETNLFTWDSANGNLRVTWDSSKPNSYLRYPLERVITSEDDFSFSADLFLNDITAAARPAFPGTFQIAFGFQHRADADKPNFIRGTGANSPNLVEFNYFPDSGFGATVWPAMIPTNGIMNYSGNGDFSIFTLPLGSWMQVLMSYTANNHTVTLTIRTNGVVVGQVVDAPLVDVQRGFRLDAFSIASYSEQGQDPSYPGSVLAHAVIDNIIFTTPPHPVGAMSGQLVSGEWVQEFYSLRGWRYRLEMSEDFAAWSGVGAEVEGTGGWVTLNAGNQGTTGHRFFRIRAVR